MKFESPNDYSHKRLIYVYSLSLQHSRMYALCMSCPVLFVVEVLRSAAQNPEGYTNVSVSSVMVQNLTSHFIHWCLRYDKESKPI